MFDFITTKSNLMPFPLQYRTVPDLDYSSNQGWFDVNAAETCCYWRVPVVEWTLTCNILTAPCHVEPIHESDLQLRSKLLAPQGDMEPFPNILSSVYIIYKTLPSKTVM